jgi:hypothetical protein
VTAIRSICVCVANTGKQQRKLRLTPASIATEITLHNITDAFDGASLEATIALIDSDACACKVLAQNDDGPDYLLRFRKTIASRAWVQEQHGVRRLSIAGSAAIRRAGYNAQHQRL